MLYILQSAHLQFHVKYHYTIFSHSVSVITENETGKTERKFHFNLLTDELLKPCKQEAHYCV